MNNEYIHLGDFEKYIRNKFRHIVNGKGLTIPRIIVEKTLDEVFDEEPATENE